MSPELAALTATRTKIVKSSPGLSARRRFTQPAALSGLIRLACQPSKRSARRIAASDEPPIQIGIGRMGEGCARMAERSQGSVYFRMSPDPATRRRAS
jgi:hypothetical protein